MRCSNRTFMELKSSKKFYSNTVGQCSNRTFMELKLAYFCQSQLLMGVLIVPLWN